MSKKRLFIIDSMAMAFRNYHAIRPLTTSQGIPVNAVYGSLMFLWSLIEREKPDYLAFATDSQEKTFRHQLYDAYKANRKEMPEDLAAQLPYLFRLFSAFQAPLLKEGGLEADDLIGSLVSQNASSDLHCYIVSGDKDFMQLINDDICLYSPKKGNEVVIVGREGVYDKFGCSPEQVIDILALMGDSSDNVPGVHGIGDKGAAKLIQDFQSLDGIYQNLDRITNARQKKGLEDNKDRAYLSQQLVTIKRDCTMHFTLDQLACNPETALANPELLQFLEELEFKTYVEKVKGRLKSANVAAAPRPQPVGPRNYHLVRTAEELNALTQRVAASDVVCFDTETTGLDRISDYPIGVSLSVKAEEAYYIPLHGEHRLLDEGVIRRELEKIFQRRDLMKVGHNIKFDLQMLRNAGIEVVGPFWDTMIASHLIDSAERMHNLDACCYRHFAFRKIPTEELLGGTKSMLNAPLDLLREYACEDADYTFRLYELFLPLIKGMELETVFHEIEMPLVPLIARIEQTGIFVDTDILNDISNHLARRAQQLEEEIFGIAGESFNIHSPKQLQVILFEKLKIHEQLGLTRLKKTKTGYSTDVSVLEQMEEHPLPRALLAFRTVTKLKSTYVDTLPQLIHPKTNRIHTNFHQTGTTTGRLSSADPNLQNIPIRSEEGREIRKAFQAGERDWVLISADYSQIELRVLAAIAKEANLREAFVRDEDIHTSTAARIFGMDPREVTANQRSQAKAINFGIIYGMGPQRLARETGVTMKAAKEFIDRYFATYPGIRDYIDRSISFAREHEYTRTITGRRRSLKEINNSRDRMAMASAQNIAVNAPIQGSAADLIKKAMVVIQKKLDEKGSRARMLLQVHDELVFECPQDEVDSVVPLIKREMEGAFDLGVPLKVEVGVGKNWLEAH